MTINKLEKCLGQHVSIIFFDGTIVLATVKSLSAANTQRKIKEV